MKKICFYLVAALFFAACEKGAAGVVPDDTQPADMKNIASTEEFEVPVLEGMVSIVCNAAGEEIARTAVPVTILAGKEDKLTVQYVEAVAGEENETRTNLWQVVAFEDSVVGDYDYNDLVIHVKYELAGNKFIAGIQPIALGSTKKIRLGCDVWQNGKYIKEGIIVADDCRAKFFPGSEGRMVNTFAVEKEYCVFDYKPYYASNYITLTDTSHPVYVNWFIEVDGNTRFYAVSTTRSTGMLDGSKRPYGLVLTATGQSYQQPGQGTVGLDWFNYPKESVGIDRVYPLFGKWLVGEYVGTLQSMYDFDAEGSFDAVGKGLYVVPNDMTGVGSKPSGKSHVIPWNRPQAEIDGLNW